MIINKVELINFRNYEKETISFKKGINFIVGTNAQGKTNLLESIYLCALGKTPKPIKEKSLIQFNKDFASILLKFSTIAGNKTINYILNKTTNKIIKINNIPILKLSSLIGELNLVYFSPDELKLVKESPEDRRKFMDISISQYDKVYLNTLLKFERILKQRNAVLKSNISLNTKKEQLNIWNQQFIETATEIILKRINFIKKLQIFAEKIHFFLTKSEKLEIFYNFNSDKDEIKKYFYNAFEKNFIKECELGFTLVGPHRDDLTLLINGLDCKYFCSQGQQRTISLSLKLAIMEIIQNDTGEYPVLLLDDVMSELDNNRKKLLLSAVSKYQTLITCTEIPATDEDYYAIKIDNGKASTNF